jgi:TolA-binding protein
MSAPTETPATPAFDAELFWEQHKSKVLLGTAAIIAALVIFAGWQISAQRTAIAAQSALASAKSADDYAKVIMEFAGSPAAGNAHLLLAASQREAKKYAEAVATLRAFGEKYPSHPFAGGGLLSLGATLEAQGKTDEAVQTYQQVATKFAATYSAPVAALAQAGILRAQGKTDEARSAYESIIAQFPDSFLIRDAQVQLQTLRK